MISRWAHTYQRWLALGGDFPFFNSGLDDPQVGPPLDYEPVGSLAGTLRVRDRAVDFGASDVPLPSDELAKLGLGQFPIVIGGVRAAVNIDGVGTTRSGSPATCSPTSSSARSGNGRIPRSRRSIPA